MKIYRTELETGINQKLFDINAENFSLDEIEFYSNIINGTISVDTLSNGYHIKGNLDELSYQSVSVSADFPDAAF